MHLHTHRRVLCVSLTRHSQMSWTHSNSIPARAQAAQRVERLPPYTSKRIVHVRAGVLNCFCRFRISITTTTTTRKQREQRINYTRRFDYNVCLCANAQRRGRVIYDYARRFIKCKRWKRLCTQSLAPRAARRSALLHYASLRAIVAYCLSCALDAGAVGAASTARHSIYYINACVYNAIYPWVLRVFRQISHSPPRFAFMLLAQKCPRTLLTLAVVDARA